MGRPLSADDIAQRREFLRQKQLEKEGKTDEAVAETAAQPTENPPIEGAKTTETKENTDENMFLAFARVYSGRIKRGQKIFVLSPRHDPASFVGKVGANRPPTAPVSHVDALGFERSVCSQCFSPCSRIHRSRSLLDDGSRIHVTRSSSSWKYRW